MLFEKEFLRISKEEWARGWERAAEHFWVAYRNQRSIATIADTHKIFRRL